jgi:hypothetical protein
MKIQKDIINFVTRANWVLLGIITILGIFFSSRGFALGLICGGLIVTLNFHMLSRTLKNALTPPYLSSYHVVIAKYFIRFLISGVIIFFLVANHYVHPAGLIIGLSVVVISIGFATLIEIKKMYLKEAV